MTGYPREVPAQRDTSGHFKSTGQWVLPPQAPRPVWGASALLRAVAGNSVRGYPVLGVVISWEDGWRVGWRCDRFGMEHRALTWGWSEKGHLRGKAGPSAGHAGWRDATAVLPVEGPAKLGEAGGGRKLPSKHLGEGSSSRRPRCVTVAGRVLCGTYRAGRGRSD